MSNFLTAQFSTTYVDYQRTFCGESQPPWFITIGLRHLDPSLGGVWNCLQIPAVVDDFGDLIAIV